MVKIVRYRIKCSETNVTAVRARIEHKLGTETTVEPTGAYGWDRAWFVDFIAPEHSDLDFLRPDVLPPKED